MGAARIAFPCWFWWIHTDSWPNLAFTGVIALAIGNVWFTLTRYIVHQLVDFVLYVGGVRGPRRSWTKWSLRNVFMYPDELGKYVEAALTNTIPPLARQHVVFRSSSVLFIYTVAEVGLLFLAGTSPALFSSIISGGSNGYQG